MLRTNWVRFVTRQRKEADEVRVWVNQRWGKPYNRINGISKIAKSEEAEYHFTMTMTFPLEEVAEDLFLIEKVIDRKCRIFAMEKDASGNISFPPLPIFKNVDVVVTKKTKATRLQSRV